MTHIEAVEEFYEIAELVYVCVNSKNEKTEFESLNGAIEFRKKTPCSIWSVKRLKNDKNKVFEEYIVKTIWED